MAIARVDTFDEAQALRDAHGIPLGKGVLILDGDKGGEPQHLIEKLIKGEKYVGQQFGTVRWKLDPLVIVVGAGGEALLQAIDAIAPGFSTWVANV